MLRIMKYRILILYISVVLFTCACSTSRYSYNTQYPTIETAQQYDGILKEHFYKCSVKGPTERRMYVYLPKDYYESTDSFPVFYLLHGARGNETSWIQKGNLLHDIDSLTNAKLMEKCIVVLPNTNPHKDDKDYGKSRIKGAVESFFELDGMVEYSFIDDVVHEIDNSYRTINNKNARAIGGLSIGAVQAMHITANYPEYFGYIGLYSSMVHPVLRHSEHSSFYLNLKEKQTKQFSEAPTQYWLMIGKTDIFYPRMCLYHRYLERNNYIHKFYTTSGGHQWYNWEDYNNLFMQNIFKGN